MDEGQGAGGCLPERPQRLGEGRLQFGEAGEVPVAGQKISQVWNHGHPTHFAVFSASLGRPSDDDFSALEITIAASGKF